MDEWIVFLDGLKAVFLIRDFTHKKKPPLDNGGKQTSRNRSREQARQPHFLRHQNILVIITNVPSSPGENSACPYLQASADLSYA